jgi:hypothetical protein
LTFEPIETTSWRRPLLDHARVESRSSSWRSCARACLLVLGVVVLGVLGDVAELARDRGSLRDLAALVGREVLDLLLQLLVALGVRMTSFNVPP